MAVATANDPGHQAQYRGRSPSLLRPDRQKGHGAAVESHGLGGHQGAGDALPAPCLGLRRHQIAGHGIRRPDHRRGSQPARADPGKSGAARRIQGHQHAVRRRADDPARRGGAGPPPCLLRHPLRARRRGRLYRGRGREGLHVARRLRHHRQLGAARSRQHLGQADAVARRARLPGGQFLRGLVRRPCRRGDPEPPPAATATR